MGENSAIGMNPILGGKWKSWCRLCAKADAEYINVVGQSQSEYEINESSLKCYKDLANAILEVFRIHIKEDDKFPQIICKECNEVVHSLIKFSERANKVQQMYEDLQNTIDKSTANLQMILDNYGINVDKDEVMISNNAMELPVEEIFVADFEETEIPMRLAGNDVKNESVKTKAEDEEQPISKDDEETEFDDPFAGDYARDNDYKATSSSSSSSENNESGSDSEDSGKHKSLAKLKERPKRKSTAAVKQQTTEEDSSKTVSCLICTEKFKRRSNYTRHMKKRHGLLNCRCCTSSFKLETELKQHMKEQHGKTWNCPHCEQTFVKKGLRSNHMRMEHSEHGVKIKPSRPSTNINRSFTCPVCGKVFPQKKQRKQHILEEHPGYEPNVCNICGRIFKEKSSLKKHLEKHGDRFMCTECGKQLTCKASLNSHMLVHSDETPHKCDVCGRCFKRPKALKYHLIAHTGLRPYSCDFCEKTFSTGSSCRFHKKTMHPNELAALEASGAVQYTKNVPKLADLRAVARTGTNFRPLMSKQNGYAPRTSLPVKLE